MPPAGHLVCLSGTQLQSQNPLDSLITNYFPFTIEGFFMFGNESYIFRTLLKWSNNIISTAFLPGLLSASCSDQSHGHNNRFTYRYWGKHEEHFVKGCRDVLDTVTCRFGKTHLRKFYFIYFLGVVYFLDR